MQMRLRPNGSCVRLLFLVLAALLLGWAAPALAEQVRVSVMTTQGDTLPQDRIVGGVYDRQFLPAVAGEVLRLRPGEGTAHWLRLEMDLPPLAQRAWGAQWVLVFNRAMVDRITLFLPAPGGSMQELGDGFFNPRSSGAALGGGFVFELPAELEGQVVLYANLRTRAAVNLDVQLVDRLQHGVSDRRLGMMLSAVYTALIVLMLNALAFHLALRERAYFHFVGLTGTTVLFLAALNGHAYGMPLLSLLGWWGVLGVYLLAFLASAFLVGFTGHFLGIGALSARADRLLKVWRYLLFTAAALCLLNLRASIGPMQGFAPLLLGASVVGLAALAWWAWRRGAPLAQAFGLILLPFIAALWLKVPEALGWIESGPFARYGFQAMAAGCAFLLSLMLAYRVVEFRRQRDRANQRMQETDTSLQAEQIRRQFAEGLRESLRTCSPGDMVWLTAKRLMSTVRVQLPQASSGIVAVGFHGFDLLLSDPSEAKGRYSQLMSARGSTLRGICRTRTPVQANFEEAAGADPEQAAMGGKFAVVPLQVAKPGWGALLLERAAWEEFSQDELKTAQALAELAVRTLEDALNQAELRKRAEIDPLTGSYNRRAFDAMIKQLFERALSSRQPISLLFIDLDHFKQVNDKHGHAAGDDCLRALAETVRKELAPGDILARYGGEEFVVVLPGQTPEQGRQTAERVRAAVAQIRVDSEKGTIKLTTSIGVSGRGAEEEDPAAMIERADKALYVAKRNGRNQVNVAPVYGGGIGGGGSDQVSF